jgi:hypothetical protein
MKRHSNWDNFVQARDYTATHTKTNSLARWTAWEQTTSAFSFQCETALDETTNLGNMASKFHKSHSTNNL